MADNIRHLNDTDFESATQNGITIVDFWAEWCMPCKALAPVFEQVAGKYAGKVKFAKVNVDESPNTASKFRIMSIPTLLVFKDGKIIEQITGLVPAKKIEAALDKALK
ncbi:MAG: thioredoxin [Deltaproteobacteria bacterium]|nr:thioredoxin [Deltaproteobacteria bacterium]